MTSQETALEEVRERLTKLERENRRLKQIGAGALIVAASLFVMGQATSRKTIEASEFILRDNSGNMRARLWVMEANTVAVTGVPVALRASPTLAFYDEKDTRAKLVLDAGSVNAGAFIVSDSEGESRGSFEMNAGQGARLLLLDSRGAQRALLEPGHLQVSDDEGFKAGLGEQNLAMPRTGETRKTSAASLLLFDKDKKVIWKAP
jgi:hypothetical protein